MISICIYHIYMYIRHVYTCRIVQKWAEMSTASLTPFFAGLNSNFFLKLYEIIFLTFDELLWTNIGIVFTRHTYECSYPSPQLTVSQQLLTKKELLHIFCKFTGIFRHVCMPRLQQLIQWLPNKISLNLCAVDAVTWWRGAMCIVYMANSSIHPFIYSFIHLFIHDSVANRVPLLKWPPKHNITSRNAFNINVLHFLLVEAPLKYYPTDIITWSYYSTTLLSTRLLLVLLSMLVYSLPVFLFITSLALWSLFKPFHVYHKGIL